MAPTSPALKERQLNRIIVPERMINGGLDSKYETDTYDIQLYGLLSCEEYQDAITRVNETIQPARSTVVDTALLITGPLLVPLALWGARHEYLTKKRKRLLKRAIQEFNAQYPELLMRYNRRPESCLTIERRTEQGAATPSPMPVNNQLQHAKIVTNRMVEVEPLYQQQSLRRNDLPDEPVSFVCGVHTTDELLPQII